MCVCVALLEFFPYWYRISFPWAAPLWSVEHIKPYLWKLVHDAWGQKQRTLGSSRREQGKEIHPLASFCFSVSGIKEQSKYWNSHTLTWQTQKSVYGSVKSGLFIREIGGFLYKSEIGCLERRTNSRGGRVFSVCGWMSAPPLRSEYVEASEEPQPSLLSLPLSLPFWDGWFWLLT